MSITQRLFVFVLLASCGLSVAAQPRPPVTGSDPFHPRQFVQIFECPSKSDGCTNPRTLLAPSGDGIVEYANAEVDRDSKILIVFDRTALADSAVSTSGFEAAVRITGRIGDRSIEIPGYSVVGEKARTAVALVRTGSEMRTAFSDLNGTYDDLVETLTQAAALNSRDLELPAPREGDETGIQLASLQREAVDTEARLRDVELELVDKETRLAGLPAPPADGLTNDPADAAQRSQNVEQRQDLNARIARLKADSTYLDDTLSELNTEISGLRSKLDAAEKVEDNQRLQVERNRQAVRRARRELLEARPGLSPLLSVLLDAANADLVRAYAEAVQQNPGRLIEITRSLDATYAALAAAAAPSVLDEYVDAVAAVRALKNGLGNLAAVAVRFDDSAGITRLQRRLIYELRDTAVLLREIDARPGDVVTLVVENLARSGEAPRSLTVRLTVREFGLVREVSDSFLFLRREGADAEEALDRLAPGEELPRDVDFEPAAGASLAWTYRPRSGGSWLNAFARFFQPGFGVNVSFPRFGKLESTVLETEVATEDGTETERVRTVQEEARLDLAFGGFLTLFDGAVIATAGLPLTSRGGDVGSDWYWGLGFSFVNIAEKLGQ